MAAVQVSTVLNFPWLITATSTAAAAVRLGRGAQGVLVSSGATAALELAADSVELAALVLVATVFR
ncbi:hypothetical protein ACQAYK_11735 [Acidithiobacillus sp. AC3]